MNRCLGVDDDGAYKYLLVEKEKEDGTRIHLERNDGVYGCDLERRMAEIEY